MEKKEEVEVQEEKRCANCRYFLRHYINSNGRFMPIVEGHCVNSEVPLRISNKTVDKNGVCERWEPKSIQTEERRTHIKNLLYAMAKDIKEIAQILKEEN